VLLLCLVLVVAAGVVRLLLLVPCTRVHCGTLGQPLAAGSCLPVAWVGVGGGLLGVLGVLVVSPGRCHVQRWGRCACRRSRACSSTCGWRALLLWLHC
jgi:hypothetical protein